MISATVVTDSLAAGGTRCATLRLTFPSWIRHIVTREGCLLTTDHWQQYTAVGLLNEQKVTQTYPSAFAQSHGVNMSVEREHVMRWNAVAGSARTAVEAMAKDVGGIRPIVAHALLSPFMNVTLLATSTQWQTVCEGMRFASEGEVRDLGEKIEQALFKSTSRRLDAGEWHLPFVDEHDVDPILKMVTMDCLQPGMSIANLEAMGERVLMQVSVARCARQEGPTTPALREVQIKNDLRLFSHLAETLPRRREYLEHVGAPDHTGDSEYLNPHLHGRADGWLCYRRVHAVEEWRDRPTEDANGAHHDHV